MLRNFVIAALALVACQVASGQEPDSRMQSVASLRFGMEARLTGLGVEVVEMTGDRPVSKKLRKGDILRAYETDIERGRQRQIASLEEIDQIKLELAQGRKILLTLLRPAENHAYSSLIIELEAADLSVPPPMIPKADVTYSIRAAAPPESVGPKGEIFVGVYYATDRKLENGQYTGKRDSGALKYGVCNVSLPPEHVKGRLERPQFWNFISGENPAKHVMIRNVAQIGRDAVYQAIGSAFGELNSPRKRVLVFIHGYNVSFADAAMRAAQMHYDLDFPGVTMFYSWPSDGDLKQYVSDMADVEWSTAHFVDFLKDLEQRDVDDVYLLAHSMGNRALLEALRRIQATGGGRKFKEIMLAAADVDAQLFNEQIAPVISSYYNSTTIYASSSDKALWSSYALSDAPRLGEIRGGSPTVAQRSKMNVIDCSLLSSDFVGHSYYGDNWSVISDLKRIVDSGPTLPRNFLKPVNGRLGPYWEFVPPGMP